MKILVTGGAGFIGTSVVRHLLGAGVSVVNLDKLTYAGSNPPLGDLADGGHATRSKWRTSPTAPRLRASSRGTGPKR